MLFPIRYADDFVILVSGSHQDAITEKKLLADYLRTELRLELSPEKTRVTSLTDGFEFLGHRIRMRWGPRFGHTPRVEIPKARMQTLRRRVKQLTKRNRAYLSLSRQLQDLNPILRGWAYFYRYCTNAKRVFVSLDWYVEHRLWCWMRKKYSKDGARGILRHRQPSIRGDRKVWASDCHEQFLIGRIPVMRFRRGWMGTPDYAMTSGEPDA